MANTSFCFTLYFIYLFIITIHAGIADRTNLKHGENIDEKLKQLEEANKNDIEEVIPESILNRHRSKGKFSCLSCSPPNCDHPTICHKAVRCYTAHVRDTDGVEHKSKGCTRNHQQTMLHCSTLSHDGASVHAKNNKSGQFAFDCCKGQMCNEHKEFVKLPPVPKIQEEQEQQNSDDNNEMNSLVIIMAVVFVMVIITILTICVLKHYFKRRQEKIALHELGNQGNMDMELRVQRVGDSTLRDLQEESLMSSGSGSGQRLLYQRSLTQDIALKELIGKGRFGVEVWKGEWNAQWVAVKSFTSRDEVSYQRETGIYGIPLLHHENILKYYGSDLCSSNGCSYNLIVTHYHPEGSLYDFLNRMQSGIPVEMAHKLILGALNGLSHLHTDIQGKQNKPLIAHRDIKSKNILVKGNQLSNISAVVADFGLALTESEFLTMDLHQDNVLVGTKRYMSPEVLDLSITKTTEFRGFLQSDMYSFGLVMWEVLRRTQLDDTSDSADDYALPYHMDVGPDPSFEEMRKVVCVAQRRPDIPDKWQQNNFVRKISSKLTELWAEKPNSRLTHLRLKKDLQKDFGDKSTYHRGMNLIN